MTVSAHTLLHFAWHLHARQEQENELVDYSFREPERQFIGDSLGESGDRICIFRGDNRPPGKKARSSTGTVTTIAYSGSF